MTLTSDIKQRNKYKEVSIIDPNPNNSYKTKKNFTGFYTEVNPNSEYSTTKVEKIGDSSHTAVHHNLNQFTSQSIQSTNQQPTALIQLTIKLGYSLK